MDAFDLTLDYIEGKNNVLADAFSQLPIMERSIAVGNNNKRRKGTPINFHSIKVPRDDTLIDDERFFTVEEMYVKDDQLHQDELYFSIKEGRNYGSIPESTAASRNAEPNQYASDN